MKFHMNKPIFFFVLVLLISQSYAVSRQQMELRTCMSSEMALLIMEHADRRKSYQENFDIGSKFGIVLGDIYKNAIWSLDDPEQAAKDIVYFAMESAPRRAELMSIRSLKNDIAICRKKFK